VCGAARALSSRACGQAAVCKYVALRRATFVRLACSYGFSPSARYNTEQHFGESFRLGKREGPTAAAGGSEWVPPPSLGAGVIAGGRASHGREAASFEEGGAGRGGGLGEMAVLPKRHERFMERFRAAKESRSRADGEAGVTSFGALQPDIVGRAD